LEYRVAKFKARDPELYGAVHRWAEVTWQRLQVFAQQAEKQAQDLREKLERAAAGTLGPGTKSLKERWREARDRRMAQVPPDPIDEALWAKYQEALEKAKSEKQKSEARKQQPAAGSQKSKEGTGDIGNEATVDRLQVTEHQKGEVDRGVPMQRGIPRLQGGRGV
jgi:hypothetical protein